jgi:hypothetical protein
MILDIVAGIFAALDAISHWRFFTCFAPAVALALLLFFSIQDKVACIALSALVLVTGALIGTLSELAALRKKSEKAIIRDGSR